MQQFLTHGMGERGGQHRADVADGGWLYPVLAACADCAAAGSAVFAPVVGVAAGVPPLGAALADGGGAVEERTDLRDRERVQGPVSESGDEKCPHVGVVVGVGGRPDPVHGHRGQPGQQVLADGHVRVDRGRPPVLGVSELLRQLVGGLLTGGAVDTDPSAGAVGGLDGFRFEAEPGRTLPVSPVATLGTQRCECGGVVP